jgi:UDP-glucose 4-epimerase
VAHPRWQRDSGLHHVMDLAEGHLAALKSLLSGGDQLVQLNLGSGQGHSVLEVIEAFGRACGRAIPYVITQRRSGDAAITVADPTEAKQQLGWQTRRNLDDMCKDGWHWQHSNPEGYSA